MGGNDNLLTAVLESVENGLAMADADLRLVICNDRWRRMFDIPEELSQPGTHWEDLVRYRVTRDAAAGEPIADIEARVAELVGRARAESGRHHAYTLTLPDGRLIDVAGNALPGGGFLRTFTDVTETRRREVALREMQERYALALTSSNEGLYDWDIRAGSIFFSDRVRHLFGLPPGLLTPDDWSSRILPDDLPVYRSAHIAHLKGRSERFTCEYRLRTGDGRLVWVRQHGIAQRGADGLAMRLTGSVGDVTEVREATRRLRESEERHALAMRALNEGVYDWDLVSDRVHVTERLRELFGLPMEVSVMPAEAWTQRVHRADREVYRAAFRALLKGETQRMELDYRIAVGADDDPASVRRSWRWVRQRGIAVRDPATGRAVRVIGSSGDITEQRDAERALEESREQLSRERELLEVTVENMDQGIFMADPMMRLVAFNHRFCEMFDLPEGFLQGSVSLGGILRYLHDRGDVPISYEKAFKRFLGEQACGTLNTHEVRRPGGRVLEARNVPLADGSFVRTFTDVTERKAAEEAVRDLIEAMPLPLVVSSLENHSYLYVNDHARRAFGIDSDGRGSALDVYADPEQRLGMVRRLEGEGRVNDFEARLLTPAGEVWVLMSARLLRYKGQRAVLVASTVITERKALEADLKAAKERAEKALQDLQDAQQSLIEAEKMASLGGLVAGVAHEINTPVGITLTTATHLEEKTATLRKLFEAGQIRKQDFADFMKVADNACRLLVSNSMKAANLIQSFKQVAVDQTSDERRRFDLARYVDEVLLSLGPKLKRTNYRISVDCPADLIVDSYPGPLSQVLTNFVMNSIIHGFDGRNHGQMHIAVTGPDTDGMIELRYSDDGRGIPSAHLKRIFDPFFTTKRGEGGSGLGLNIVYNIVTQSLKGTIRGESTEGAGATFVVRFPQALPAEVKVSGPDKTAQTD